MCGIAGLYGLEGIVPDRAQRNTIVRAMTDSLRVELEPWGIHVAIIEPGTIRTEFASRALGESEKARHANSRYKAVYAHTSELEARFARMAGGTGPVVAAIERGLFARRPLLPRLRMPALRATATRSPR